MKRRWYTATLILSALLSIWAWRSWNPPQSTTSERPRLTGNTSQIPVQGQSSPTAIATPPSRADASDDALVNSLSTGGAVSKRDDALAGFEDWARGYLAQLDPSERTARLEEGVRLAEERRVVMAEWIRLNPRRALAMAAPWRWYRDLPGEIVSRFEERISGRGRLEVYCASSVPGEDHAHFEGSTLRYLKISGRTFRAWVYGRLLREITREDLPVHGVALDGSVALHEDPIRILEPEEAADTARPAGSNGCMLCGRVFAGSGSVLGELGGRLLVFCGESHAVELNGILANSGRRGLSPMALEPLPEPDNPWTLGVKRALLIRTVFADDTAVLADDLEAARLMQETADYYARTSYGETTIVPTITPVLAVAQGKLYYSAFGPGALLTDAYQAARQAGYNPDNFDLPIVHFTAVPGFDWGGLGAVGAPGCWVQAGGSGVIIHELGHNFGLGHANALNTTRPPAPNPDNGLPFDINGPTGHDSIYGPGDDVEYGDPFDVMGSGPGEFTPIGRHALGWLPASSIALITSSSTNRIHVHDAPALIEDRFYALAVAKDNERVYWLSARANAGSNPWLQNGMALHFSAWSQAIGNSQILDTTPGSLPGLDDSPITVGRTFSDVESGIHITPVARGGIGEETWYDVVVQLGTFPENRAPELEVAASAFTVPAGTSITFTASASDVDGDAVAYSWDFGDGSFGGNNSTVSHTFASAGDYVVRCEVSDFRGGVASRHLVVTAGAPRGWRISGRILDTSGLPVQGARVHNGAVTNRWQLAAEYQATHTDSDGAFTLVNLPDGMIDLTAFQFGYDFQPLNFTSPLTLVGADAIGVEFLAMDWPRVHVEKTSDADATLTRAGYFLLSRTGDLTERLRAYFWLGGTAQDGVDYTTTTNREIQTNIVTTLLGSVDQLLDFYYVDFAPGVAATNVEIRPDPAAAAGVEKTALLTLVYPVQITRISVTDTNVVDLPGWETVTLDSRDLWMQTRPDYLIAPNASAEMTLKNPAAAVAHVSVLALDDSATEIATDSILFALARSGRLDESLTVQLEWRGTATAGSDYQRLPTSVIFAPGQSLIDLKVVIIPDSYLERDETIEVRIVPNAAYQVVEGSASARLWDNDFPLVTVRALDAVASEADGLPALLLIERSGDHSIPLTIQYLQSGTGVSGTDYVPLSGSVQLPAGQTATTLAVTPRDDRVADGSKTVIVLLSDSPLYNIGWPGAATVTLLDAALPTVSLSVLDDEAGEPSDTAALAVTRNGNLGTDLEVRLKVGGTARPFEDYGSLGDRVRIPAGVAQVTLTITPVNDDIREDEERIVVDVAPAPNYNVGDLAQGVVQLVDDDGGSIPGIGFNLLSSIGFEGQGSALIAIALSTETSDNDAVTVDYRVTGGTAVSGVDYDPMTATGRVVFPAGGGYSNQVQLVELTLNDNQLMQSNRTLVLSLFEPYYSITNELATNEITITNILGELETTNVVSTNVLVTGVPMNARFDLFPAHTLTIVDDDAAIVDIETTVVEARELGARSAILTFTRQGPTNLAQTIHLDITGSASPGNDYHPLPNPVIIPPGLDFIDLLITPIDDPVQEFTESVRVEIARAPGATIGNAGASVRIIDNDGTIEFESTVYEELENIGTALLAVRRTTPVELPVRVDYQVRAGSALAGVDFVATNGTLEFAAGQSTVHLPVILVDDAEVEAAETVELALTNPSGGGALAGQTTATLIIIDQDSGLRFTRPDFRVAENGTNVVIGVERVGVATNATAVDYVLLDGTAVVGADYVVGGGTLTFAVGERLKSFRVDLLDDAEFEGDETILMSLTNALAGSATADPALATLQVIDDECTLEFALESVLVDEYARVLNVEVRRGGGQVNPVSVDFRSMDGTALAGVDYRAIQGTLGFAGEVFVPMPDGSGSFTLQPGATNATFLMRILDDVEGEGHETFDLVLENARTTGGVGLAGSAILGPVSRATVRIIDNELPGSVDFEFNPGLGPDGIVRSVAVQPDGKVIIGGDFTKVNGVLMNRVARLHLDGYLDSFFNPGSGANGRVHAVALRPDGRLMIGGEFTRVAGLERNRIARLNADGSLDGSFPNFGGADGLVRCFAVASDGSVMVGGDFGSVNGSGQAGLTRLLEDGSPDLGFVPVVFMGSVRCVVLEPDGRILAGGTQGIVRLLPDGSADPAFNPAGVPDGTVNGIARHADGRIIAVGDFTRFGSTSLRGIARLQVDGSLDTAFQPGDGANAAVQAVGVQNDGRILIGGAFTAFRGEPLNRIARLNADGSLDTGFDIGTGANDLVRSLVVQPDTALVIGGDFTVVNGLPRPRVARIHGDDRFVLGRIVFGAATYEVAEDAGTVAILISRSGPLDSPVSVDIETVPGTATPGEDFGSIATSVDFAAGQSEATVNVEILDDTLGEGDETLELNLINLPPGFDLNGFLTTTVVIRDNESAISFATAATTAAEHSGTAGILVVRTGAIDAPAEVDVVLGDGTASVNDDFIASSTRLMFETGQSEAEYSIEILDDTLEEFAETILLSLANASGSVALGSVVDHTLTIEDNDRIAFYSLNITPPIGGTVTPPSGVYPAGSTQTVAAIPANDYEFLGWTGTLETTVNPIILVMDRDISLTARFRPLHPTFTFEPPFEGPDLSAAPWRNTSASKWALESQSTGSGAFAVRSGPVPDGQTTILELLVGTRAGPASFDYRVSSERNWDFLEFYLNGLRLQRWSGDIPWQTYHFNVPAGLNHLSWRYVRDANFASGMDGAILDNIYVPLVIPPPTNVAPARLTLTLQANGVATIQVTGTPGARYITEGSTNLAAWTPIATNVLQEGPAVVQDPAATNHPVRLYRSIGQ